MFCCQIHTYNIKVSATRKCIACVESVKKDKIRDDLGRQAKHVETAQVMVIIYYLFGGN